MVTLGGFRRWGDKGSDAHLGVEGDGLAADLVETLHPDDVVRDDDDGREEAALVRVARHDLERVPPRRDGTAVAATLEPIGAEDLKPMPRLGPGGFFRFRHLAGVTRSRWWSHVGLSFIPHVGGKGRVVEPSKRSMSARLARRFRPFFLGHQTSASGTFFNFFERFSSCLLYTSPSPRDQRGSRMPSSA